MARRRKGGISLSLPPFLVPVLASADGGAGIACNGCRAPLDAGSARLRRIIFRPRRPKEPHHGTISAGVQFDPPLTRLQERNSWRQAILQYQQQRRRQIRFEDQIKLNLRQLLRQLELDRLNLENQRRAVIIAVRRVDETRLTLGQPAAPPPVADADGRLAGESVTDRLGPTTIINYVTATDALRNSQDALTSVWLRYYQTRALLARELGVMELTDDGLWIDKPLCLVERGADDDLHLPPPVPEEWLEHLEEVAAPPPLGAAADGKPAAEPLPSPAAAAVN